MVPQNFSIQEAARPRLDPRPEQMGEQPVSPQLHRSAQADPVLASASTASHVVPNVTKKSFTLVISIILRTLGFTPVSTRHRPVFWCDTQAATSDPNPTESM